MNLVAEWITMSAPYSSGRQSRVLHVIHDKGDPSPVGYVRNCLKIHNVKLRIAAGFSVDRFRPRFEHPAEILRICRVHKGNVNTETLQCDFEKVVCAPV